MAASREAPVVKTDVVEAMRKEFMQVPELPTLSKTVTARESLIKFVNAVTIIKLWLVTSVDLICLARA